METSLKIKKGGTINQRTNLESLGTFLDEVLSLSEATQTDDVAQKRGGFIGKADKKKPILEEEPEEKELQTEKKSLYETALDLDTEEEFGEYLENAEIITIEDEAEIEEKILEELGEKEFALLPLILGEEFELKGLLLVVEEQADLVTVGEIEFDDLELTLVEGRWGRNSLWSYLNYRELRT